MTCLILSLILSPFRVLSPFRSAFYPHSIPPFRSAFYPHSVPPFRSAFYPHSVPRFIPIPFRISVPRFIPIPFRLSVPLRHSVIPVPRFIPTLPGTANPGFTSGCMYFRYTQHQSDSFLVWMWPGPIDIAGLGTRLFQTIKGTE